MSYASLPLVTLLVITPILLGTFNANKAGAASGLRTPSATATTQPVSGSRPRTPTQTYCVSDAAGLQTALGAWESAADTTQIIIDLTQGEYDISTIAGQFTANSTASLQILGGFASGCDGAQREPDARTTIIDGYDQPNSEFSLLAIDADVLIEGVTFTRIAHGVQMIHNGSSTSATAHTLRVSRCRIIENTATSGATLRLYGVGFSGASGAAVVLDNSLIARNTNTSANYFAVFGTYNNGTVRLTQNTITDNRTFSGVQIQTLPTSGVSYDIINNIFWHNGNNAVYKDIDVQNANTPSIGYSVLGTVVGAIASDPSNSTLDPQFIDASGGNYFLRDTSMALDSGAPASIETYPATDVDGTIRVQGAAIDRGALETTPHDFIFVDSFGG